MAQSKIVELFSRLIKVQDRKDKIYLNGSDNLYPERIERIINNSVTAKLSADKMISFLSGLGFEGDINEIIFNKKKGLTFYDLLKRACNDVGYQKGFYLHINYDVQGVPNYLDVLKFKNCRISEEDDYDYKGYIWYSKEWKTTDILSVSNKKQKNWYYPYNPDIDIINEQRKKDAPKDATIEQLVKNYRGQVLFVNLDDDSVYPNSWIDPAYNDADTEHRISLFRNDRIKTGFLGANIIVLPETEDGKQAAVTDEEIKALLGAENSSNILRIEAKLNDGQKLSDAIHIQTIKSEVDTEQFQYDEKIVQENILNCFKIPKVLVKGSDGALFGPSGELLKVAQQVFQQNTEMERDIIERAFNKVFFNHPEYKDKFKIVPLIKDETVTETPKEDGESDNI